MSKLPHYLARAELQRTDWKLMRALERQLASPEWCEWRDELRRLVAMVDGFDAIPPEPPFGGRATDPRDKSVFAEPVIQEPERARDDLLDFDAEPVEELTGDQLLSAFEKDEEAAALLVQTLSALRQKHISEQLNVERARLDREHQATGVANPRSAQIDRLLGLLTRRGEV